MEESNRTRLNEDEEQRVRRSDEVEGHRVRRDEGSPVEDEGEGRVRFSDQDDDGPEVEGHVKRTAPVERVYKKA